MIGLIIVILSPVTDHHRGKWIPFSIRHVLYVVYITTTLPSVTYHSAHFTTVALVTTDHCVTANAASSHYIQTPLIHPLYNLPWPYSPHSQPHSSSHVMPVFSGHATPRIARHTMTHHSLSFTCTFTTSCTRSCSALPVLRVREPRVVGEGMYVYVYIYTGIANVTQLLTYYSSIYIYIYIYIIYTHDTGMHSTYIKYLYIALIHNISV